MAIAIRGTTPGIATSNGSPSLVLNGTRQPNAGDVLIIIHCNNYYTLANMPTPTVGGSTAGVTAITNGSADGGTDNGHVKSYYYVVGSTADLTVAVTETGTADEEKAIIGYVLSGVDTTTPIDVAANATDAPGDTSIVAPSASPTSSDAFLICHASSGPENWGASAQPGGMSETYEAVFGGFLSYTGATLQLSASGSTGTKTFTVTNITGGTSPLLSIAVKTSSGPAAPAEQSAPTRWWVPLTIRQPIPMPFLRQPVSYWPEVVAALSVDQTDDAGLTDAVLLDRGLVYTNSAGLVDAVLLARSLEFTDSAGLTDTAALTISQVVTDSAGLTDTSLVQSGKVVTQTDSAGLVDAAVIDRTLVYTDSVGLTDSAVLARSVQFTDSSGLTDTSIVQPIKLVAATDDAGLTDGTLSLQFVWLKTDSAGLTDTSTVTATGAAIYTDSVGLVDTASVQQAKEVTDSTGLVDTATAQAAKFVTVTDSAGLTDGSTSFQFVWVVTDSVGLTDAATPVSSGGATVTQTDSVGLTDVRELTLSKTVTDSTGLVDAATVQAAKLIVATDAAGLTDAGLTVDVEETFTDSAGLTDVRELALSKLLTDSAGLTDAASVQAGRFINPTDSAGLTDSATSSQAKGITDDAGLTDTRAFATTKVLTDSAGLTDSVLAVGGRDITVTDSAGLTDTRNISKGLEPTDSVGLTDTIAFAAAYRYTDTVGLTDTSSVDHQIPVVFGRGASSNGNAQTGNAGRGTAASGRTGLTLAGSGQSGRG